jgi:hypothetical protein
VQRERSVNDWIDFPWDKKHEAKAPNGNQPAHQHGARILMAQVGPNHYRVVTPIPGHANALRQTEPVGTFKDPSSPDVLRQALDRNYAIAFVDKSHVNERLAQPAFQSESVNMVM